MPRFCAGSPGPAKGSEFGEFSPRGETAAEIRHEKRSRSSLASSCERVCCHRRRLSPQAIVWWALLPLLLSLVTPAHQRLVVVNEGSNVTLGCGGAGDLATWILPNRANTSGTLVLQESGDLLILRAAPAAAGVYTCTAEGGGDTSAGSRIELRVRTVPHRVANLTVTPHSVYAIVSWSFSPSPDLIPDGFLCEYRQQDDPSYSQQEEEERTRDLVLRNSSAHLGPDTRTCDLYDLTPATQYYVQVGAYNELGAGQFMSTVFTTSNRSLACSHSSSSFFLPEYGRLLAISLSVSTLSLAILAIGLILLLWHRRKLARPVSPSQEELPDDEECLELVPHITLNPSFNIEMLEHISPDYNESSEHAFLMACTNSANSTSRQQGAER